MKHRKARGASACRWFAALALTVVIPCAWTQGNHRVAVVEAPSAPLAEAAAANRVLELTNEERQQRGMAPLRLNPKLCEAARWMALDMARNRYFDHVDRQGRSVAERASSFGYVWRSIGENLAAGQRSPEEAVADWLGSPGHRKNILRAEFEEIGIAYVEVPGSEFKRYWVQVFGAPQRGR